jgi:hypothetical protein
MSSLRIFEKGKKCPTVLQVSYVPSGKSQDGFGIAIYLEFSKFQIVERFFKKILPSW